MYRYGHFDNVLAALDRDIERKIFSQYRGGVPAKHDSGQHRENSDKENGLPALRSQLVMKSNSRLLFLRLAE
ncbi:MAG: hypothetical protein DMG34_09815 [Acidobacteria bacterium]|nr:MAG: hypothetical protein DMG34_09815 [Acidobacteriota bacterium]